LETWLLIAATDPNVAAADTHVDSDSFTEDPGVDNDEDSELPDPPPRQRRPFNRQGMGGNQNHHNQHYVRNDDPFAKVKISIPPFNGSYDAEDYLDQDSSVGWVPIFWEVWGKSIGGDLNVDDEGSKQRRFKPMQSWHDGSVGYQPVRTWIGLTKKAMSLQANREHKQE
jgi:hypothetical protein